MCVTCRMRALRRPLVGAPPEEDEPVTLSTRQIRRAEQNLRAAGHHQVKVDGHLTAAEKKTLKAVQAATGHEATGKLDAGTRKELAHVAAWTRGHSDFTAGEKSTAIRNAEKRLAALGLAHGKVDGILDQKTAKALKAFQ